MIDFTGRRLFLTGANGGIPRAIATLFGQLGADLVLTDRDEAPLAEFARGLAAGRGTVVTQALDVTDPAAVDAAIDGAGAIDFLVTGAGIYPEAAVAEMTDADWRRTLAVNLDGVFHCCRAAARALRDHGAVVNIASMAGHRGSNRHAHYAAAKGAVLSFSRSLMHELAPRGIRVNAVSPGLIDTPMVQPLMAARGPALLAATPLGRLGTAAEVAGAVAFLCSDWASFITGETIQVNGGLHIAA
ncbi:MAG TPA: SDR family NAD(P)-dependent oxidoreductase [Roseomonas sp.]|jgi:3-oxoacyl-[acyl-carrier protein] reductase